MNAKKWVLTFLLLALVLALGLAAFNYVTDPFAAFGDKFLNWFSYDETNNPRVAKISYLEQHHDEYDSYDFWAVLRPVRCKSQTSTNFTTQISII